MIRALLFALSLQTLAIADAQKVRVLRVIDGDTVVIRTGKGQSDILRFAAIDTPELRQPGGKEAKAYLQHLLATARRQPLHLTTTGRRDRYRRLLGTLTLPDGQSISALLLTSGHARRWPAPSPGPPALKSPSKQAASSSTSPPTAPSHAA